MRGGRNIARRSGELVVVSFMHPQPDEREALLDRVARALVPGGHVGSASSSPTTAAGPARC